MSNKKIGFGLVAAMESENAPNDTELAIDEAGADSMEADLVETVDLAADIDQGTSEIESTMKDADQLEKHVEVLTEAEGEGGAAPQVVEATEIAVESIYQRLGIYGDTGIPALESFSTKHGKATNTRVAIEAISENIKRIWEAVKMALKKLVNYVKDFFGKLFDTNQKMLARVNTLRTKIKAAQAAGGTAAEKISGSGITNVIGSTDAAGVKKGIESAHYGEAVKAALADADSLGGFLAGVSDQGAFDKASWSSAGGNASNVPAPEGLGWFTLVSFGASDVMYLAPKSAATGDAAYAAASKYSVKVAKNDAKGDGEIAPLSLADCSDIVGKVETKVRELMNAKTQIAQIQSKLDAAVADINKAASGAAEDDKDIGNRSTKARSAVTAVANGSIKLVSVAGAEFTRGLQACLTLVERSVASYKKEEAAAPAKGAEPAKK